MSTRFGEYLDTFMISGPGNLFSKKVIMMSECLFVTWKSAKR